MLAGIIVLIAVVVGWKALRDYMGPGGTLDLAAAAQTQRYAYAVYDQYLDSHGGDMTALSVGLGTHQRLSLADTVCSRSVDLVYLPRPVTRAEARMCAHAGVKYVVLPVAERVFLVVGRDSLRREGVEEYVRTNVEHGGKIAKAAGAVALDVSAAQRALERAIADLDATGTGQAYVLP